MFWEKPCISLFAPSAAHCNPRAQPLNIYCVFFFALSGTKTPDSLREKLETALRNNDRETLEKVIDDCISSGHPELISEINQTRKYLDGQGGISGRGG